MTTINPCYVDLFAGDERDPKLVVDTALAGPPWHGFLAKVTEGSYYESTWWFPVVWALAQGRVPGSHLAQAPQISDAACAAILARLGVDWWVMAYHYLIVQGSSPEAVKDSAKRQAEIYVKAILKAGGCSKGAGYGVIDFERGGQRVRPTASKAADAINAFASVVECELGRKSVLYTGEYSRSIGLRLDMTACVLAWVAAYTPTFSPAYFQPICPLSKVGWWQYCGDGETYLANYPKTTPTGAEDISAQIVDAGAGNEHMRAQNFPEVK